MAWLPMRRVINTKCVDSAIEPGSDGLRILATRGRGRGLPPDRYDDWMPNLGPSEQLRDGFLSGQIPWGEYGRRYLKELRESGTIDLPNQRIYFGWYSNASRGTRRKAQDQAQEAAPEGTIEISPPSVSPALKQRWAQLIKKIYEADPLLSSV
jgi:uncharacterized protein YeaO (DUF488 family)